MKKFLTNLNNIDFTKSIFNVFYALVVIAICLGIVSFFAHAFHFEFFSKSEQPTTIIGDTIQSRGKVTEFEYNGHVYINIVKTNKDNIPQSYVVHSPSCKCTSNKLNNITTVITRNDNENKANLEKRCVDNFNVIINKLNKLENDNRALKNELTVIKSKLNKPVTKVTPKKSVQKKVIKKK